MSSRRMSLLPRATLHSDSKHLLLFPLPALVPLSPFLPFLSSVLFLPLLSYSLCTLCLLCELCLATAGLFLVQVSMGRTDWWRVSRCISVTRSIWPPWPTTLLTTQVVYFILIKLATKKMWRCRGLNPRPSVCETDALPLSYIPFDNTC
jgi:hypothetical protein